MLSDSERFLDAVRQLLTRREENISENAAGLENKHHPNTSVFKILFENLDFSLLQSQISEDASRGSKAHQFIDTSVKK